jgi:hypothetical protein
MAFWAHEVTKKSGWVKYYKGKRGYYGSQHPGSKIKRDARTNAIITFFIPVIAPFIWFSNREEYAEYRDRENIFKDEGREALEDKYRELDEKRERKREIDSKTVQQLNLEADRIMERIEREEKDKNDQKD